MSGKGKERRRKEWNALSEPERLERLRIHEERKQAAIAKRQQEQPKPEQLNDDLNKADSLVLDPEIFPHLQEGLGAKGGLQKKSELPRLLTKAANWQQKNRVPVELRVSADEKLVPPKEGEPDTAEEILINAVKQMRSADPRLQASGLRAGVQLIRSVQLDDHAKLRAELRPTQTGPSVIIDQSTHTDNRRVMLMIPDNGRDPQKYASIARVESPVKDGVQQENSK